MEVSEIMRRFTVFEYFILLCITKHTYALTGLCQTEIGRATCFSCSDISYPINELANAPRDCCGDPYIYSVCERCLFDPDSCIDNTQNTIRPWSHELVEDSPKTQEDLLDTIRNTPERRSKYFLGKRDNTRAFLGKRDNTRAFLGKRADPENSNAENDIQNALMEEEHEMRELLGKRPNQFLGKRIGDLLADSDDSVGYDVGDAADKYGNPANDADDKRGGSPFLGKRSDDYKRGRPFLGKRDDMHYLSFADNVKRGRPFLGKRGSQYFLGKRVGSNQQPTMEQLKNLYMRPLARRAKYFLGKRSEGENSLLSKRQKYFLGKKSFQESGALHAEGFVNNLSGMKPSQDLNEDKRQKYFLGKRSIGDIPDTMTSSEK